MGSQVRSILEKLGVALVGEDPETAVIVLACFTATVLKKYGVRLEQYADMVREAMEPDPIN